MHKKNCRPAKRSPGVWDRRINAKGEKGNGHVEAEGEFK
jgi:hypothetical protein